MKVLLLNHFFSPDGDAVAQLAADLAEDLVAAGHQVTVLAARGGYPGGRRLPARETWRGVQVVRTGGTSFGKGSIAGRLADYATFFATALVTALTLPRHDVVLATTAPPLVASIGAVLRVVKGTRFVYWLQDVYPELAVAFGVLGPRSPVTWAFERISRATLRRADGVVVLGEAMAERVRAKGVVAGRVHVIPNWADGAGVRPVAHEANAFRREHGLDGKRVVLYSGNMGRGHDLATLLEAARRLRGETDLVFAFVGGGGRRAEVEAAARELPSSGCSRSSRVSASPSRSPRETSTSSPWTPARSACSSPPSSTACWRRAARLVIGPAELRGRADGRARGRRRGGGERRRGRRRGGAEAPAGGSAPLGERARTAFERTYDRRHRTRALVALLEQLAVR